MNACRTLLFLLLVTTLSTLGGCQMARYDRRDDVPPEPPARRTRERGLLLDTDPSLLSPAPSRSLWIPYGNGLWGF